MDSWPCGNEIERKSDRQIHYGGRHVRRTRTLKKSLPDAKPEPPEESQTEFLPYILLHVPPIQTTVRTRGYQHPIPAPLADNCGGGRSCPTAAASSDESQPCDPSPVRETILDPPRFRIRAPEENAVVGPAARDHRPVRAPRQTPDALGVEAPPPPGYDGRIPARRGVYAHVADVGCGEHRTVGGKGHGLDRMKMPPLDHVRLVERRRGGGGSSAADDDDDDDDDAAEPPKSTWPGDRA